MLTSTKISVAILLPVHNRIENTRTSLTDLQKNTAHSTSCAFHIILIDDGSSDGTSNWVRSNFRGVHIMKGDGNLWWSGAVNMGARYAIEDLQTDYLLLWNNDIKVERNYFSKLPDIIRRNGKDTIIGSKVLVEEDTSVVWSMGGFFDPGTGKHGMFGYFKQDSDEYSKVHKADWLTGMGTVVPAEAVRTVGYWDSENFPQYHGDSDFTYRAKLKGYELIVDPGLVIYNSTKSSGIEHDGSFKKLLKLFTDTRSKSNFKRNFRFYKLYATSVRAYIPLLLLYVRIFLGFFKWKFLHFFGTERR